MSQNRMSQNTPTKRPRYAIGIDLGTSNSALSYTDLLLSDAEPHSLRFSQYRDLNSLVDEPLLPSCLYFATDNEQAILQNELPGLITEHNTEHNTEHTTGHSELAPSNLSLHLTIGQLARNRMSTSSSRVISSAKSWLCHRGIDPSRRILPWGSNDISEDAKLSPLQATSELLRCIKGYWDKAFIPEFSERFEDQDVTITVPASFDEVAQRLTLEAARLAGFPESTRLIEEPQAAFYLWLFKQRQHLPDLFRKETIVLICDVGGGTTDFSLFKISISPVFKIERLAVSNHILLGGDNIDLTIAHKLEEKLRQAGHTLTLKEWANLLSQARALKERVLSQHGISSDIENSGQNTGHNTVHNTELDSGQGANDGRISIVIPRGGSSLFSSTISMEISPAEILELVLDGFFPECDWDAEATANPGLRELGLPYAKDSAITRHLAQFTRCNLHDALTTGQHIDAVLYTGGTLKPQYLRRKLTAIVESWRTNIHDALGNAPEAPIQVLEYNEFDLGVALGAAHFGAKRFHNEELIEAGYPHSIYLELSKKQKKTDPKTDAGTFSDSTLTSNSTLICITPRGLKPGEVITIANPPLEVLVDRPIRFNAFFSNKRFDLPGEIVPTSDMDSSNRFADIFFPLPPLETKLQMTKEGRKATGAYISVLLSCRLNDLGLLQISVVEKMIEKAGGLHERQATGQNDVPNIAPLSWLLEFNLRVEDPKTTSDKSSSTEQPCSPDDNSGATALAIQLEHLQQARKLIASLYGKSKSPEQLTTPKSLGRDLESVLHAKKSDWSLSLCRTIWQDLASGMTRRDRSLLHETTWLTLTGYTLRPGFGEANDSHRIDEQWRLFHLGLAFPKEKSSVLQWWILWRRVAGGLNPVRQQELSSQLLPLWRKHKYSEPELICLLAALEYLPISVKETLVTELTEFICNHPETANPQFIWALGRLLARVPLAAGPEVVLPPEIVCECFERLGAIDWKKQQLKSMVTLFLQAARLTDVRYIDLPEADRQRIHRKLAATAVAPDELAPLLSFIPQNDGNRAQLFGESLPVGIRLA